MIHNALLGALVVGCLNTILLESVQAQGPQVASDAGANDKDSGDAGTQAMDASAFLSSLGINIHISQGYPEANYAAGIKYTGIRNVRDSFGNLSRLLLLHHQTGVKVDLLGDCNVDSVISSAEDLASADSLLSVEGANEPNNFPVKYDGQSGGGSGSWLPVAQCQKALFYAVRESAALHSIPVFSVSEAGAETDNVGLQFLTIPSGAGALMPDGTRYADFANPHNYVSSNVNSHVDNQAWQAADPTFNGPWDGLYGEYGRTWNGKFSGYTSEQLLILPRVSTETGWDSVANSGGDVGQGKILINTYLSQFKRGWSYTFIYEMIDGEGGTGAQGIYTSDDTPKPAAIYIHNLTSVLADVGSTSHRSSLNYKISKKPDTVHDLLLQKSNGTFEILIWGESVAQTFTIPLKFSRPHKTINIYDVTSGEKPVRTYNTEDKVQLTIGDHAIIVEVAG